MDMNIKTKKDNEERVAEEYLSSLSDLNCNSKPLINMLTMLAEENIEYAPIIVKVVEQHIVKVPPDIKLPLLYLIDSIVKNVKSTYIHLFSQCIVNIFCDVFEKVNEKIRERMYALRQTWNEVFPSQKLYALDVKVKRIDNNWPITAKQAQPSIHVNPNFLKTVGAVQSGDVEEILQAKTRELLVLKKRKLELELEATKKSLEEQEKQLCKTADGVVPPGDQLADSKSLNTLHIQGVPTTQIVPPALMTTHMRSQGTPTVLVGGAVPSTLFNPSFRNPRTHIQHVTPSIIGVGSQSYPPAGNAGKPKVHPVNPALLNTVKHRDPRLARHQQLHETVSGGHDVQKSIVRNSLGIIEEKKKNSKPSSPYRNGNSKNDRSIDESSSGISGEGGEISMDKKSSGRHSTSESQRKSGSPRDKEKYRKRSISKSSTTSSSSAGSNSAERQKNSSFSSNRLKIGGKCDKDAFEIASLSTAFKRKSPSVSDSSSKKKESKRKSYTHLQSNKRHSRSRSPTIISAESAKDGSRNMPTSPRKHQKSYITDSDHEEEDKNITNITENLESKNIEIVAGSMAIAAKKDTDLRRFPSSYSPELEQVVASEAPNEITTVATPSPKVSFKIHKLFNKLEKSTERPATVAVDNEMSKTSLVIANSDKQSNDVITGTLEQNTFKIRAEPVPIEVNDDKKRPPNNADDEEPLAKKSKSTKFDALFGDEDVDLRTVMPPQIMAAQQQTSVGSPTPPPPPVITGEHNVENWNNLKTVKTSSSNTNKSSNLEDVRAKLAKATKYNKFSKPDKYTNDFSQRLKLTELNVNDDSQEANDEKIRTIVAQAQELLEAKSINQDQYRNLMQKVMSINEANKLKEAKRRESFNNYGPRSKPLQDEEINDSDRSAAAAREAVLKKRIPKLVRNQGLPSEDSLETNFGASNETKSTIYDERSNLNEVEIGNARTKSSKEKKSKPTKWCDKINSSNPCEPGNSNSKGWLKAPGIRPHHSVGGFHATVPGPPQMPWQLNPNMPPPVSFINPIPIPNMQAPIPIPPSIPKPCNSIDNPQADLVRTITIDGLSKEIRIYDQIAIVFMELDQPREIGFQAGQRSIIIDEDSPIALQFNDEYKTFTINGEPHSLRFGFPSRELYIDEHWYEIYFGGPPVSIPIKNKLHILKAEGPPPQVNIGALRRDLVVGKINMIVDAHIVIPLFLDAKPQTFKLAENEHTVQFADNLLTVLLDGEATKVEYGGLPKSYTLNSICYFIRFGALPQGVVAGKIKIKDMIYVKTEPSVETSTISDAPLSASSSLIIEEKTNEKVMVEVDQSSSGESQAEVVTTSEIGAPNISMFSSTAHDNINIDELFQKLVSSGILSGSTATNKSSATSILPSAAVPEDTPQPVEIRPIDLSKTETIKTRQAAIVEVLFSGMQCSSCGVRFPPEQTIKYSQHLDWHFRQNRRERDLSRKAHSRKWYYDLTDWVQYEEIEDLEEREKNFFESQQNEIEINDDTSNQRWLNSPILSCPALPEDVDRACDMCHEKFEQFYNEDLEEWHLRSALRVNDKIYHPLCYEDYKASLNSPKVEDKTEETVKENADTMDVVIKIEGDEKNDQMEDTKDDEDDDVIVLPNEEPSVTEIDDDDEYVPENISKDVEARDENNSVIDATGSDVEIQEPNIPFTDLDTYEEKQLSEFDESSQISFLNIKIKEEPKDDEDEDDGFEDVGTVVIAPEEEISIQSSEETQTHTIVSNGSGPSSNIELPPSSTSTEQVESTENVEISPATVIATDLSTSVDGILETEDEINLSTVGPSPAVPLASLVNRIKINIAKNNSSANSSSSNNNNSNSNIATLAGLTPSVVPKATVTDSGVNEENPSLHENHKHSNVTALSVVSTIPVLCGGGTSSVRTTVATSNSSAKNPNNEGSNVSTISVIGSYGNTSAAGRYYSQPNTVASTGPRAVTPPSDEITAYQLKPSLQNITLTKTKRIQCGVETSGLCSIM